MVATPQRIGLIVPSSNTTIETEVPLMLQRADVPARFTFHSSRAVLHSVDAGSLDRMVEQADRCAHELADAQVDAILYACLVALMARGPGAHEPIERDLGAVTSARLGHEIPIISSAGALVRTIQRMGAERVAMMTPYVPELTAMVTEYLERAGIEVVDSVSLAVDDNASVGRLDPAALPEHIGSMDLSRADVLIASACVQMPSLPAVPDLERRFGLPVITAATATVFELLSALGLPRRVPDAGGLLREDPGSAVDDRGLGRAAGVTGS